MYLLNHLPLLVGDSKMEIFTKRNSLDKMGNLQYLILVSNGLKQSERRKHNVVWIILATQFYKNGRNIL